MAKPRKAKRRQQTSAPASNQPIPQVKQLTPKEQAELDANREAIQMRWERMTHDKSPCCNRQAPKHDRTRPTLVYCDCGSPWMTVPGAYI